MNSRYKGKISYALQAIGILPLLLFGIAVMILISHWFTAVMYDEVERGLTNIANNMVTLLDVAHPGDYQLKGDVAYELYKGDYNLTSDYTLVDRIKENTELDVSLYYQDTCILTTIYDSSGKRIVGTGAPEQVMNDVFKTGNAYFYDRVLVNGTIYFAYYMPLYNEDGSIVGMIFVGHPSQMINSVIHGAIYHLAIMVVLTLIIAALCIFLYTRRLVTVLIKIHDFLTMVSSGNMYSKLDPRVLERTDELGDIGRSALKMQHSLRGLIEKDSLTNLYNRRYANRKLSNIVDNFNQQGAPFSIALSDLDYFKNINDTYGHECGDLVLKNIADTLRQHMHSQGFVARWGGEEFLLVFDHFDRTTALKSLESLMEKIRNTETIYNGQSIHVTMTFGLVNGTTDNINQLLKEADDKLYQGKSHGRNQIIS